MRRQWQRRNSVGGGSLAASGCGSLVVVAAEVAVVAVASVVAFLTVQWRWRRLCHLGGGAAVAEAWRGNSRGSLAAMAASAWWWLRQFGCGGGGDSDAVGAWG